MFSLPITEVRWFRKYLLHCKKVRCGFSLKQNRKSYELDILFGNSSVVVYTDKYVSHLKKHSKKMASITCMLSISFICVYVYGV